MALFRFERSKVIPTKELVEIKAFRKLNEMEDSDRLLSYVNHDDRDWETE